MLFIITTFQYTQLLPDNSNRNEGLAKLPSNN